MDSNPTVEFPYEEWQVTRDKSSGELVGIHPIRGSWTLLSGEDRRRMAERGMFVKGIIACPRCNNSGFLPENFDPPKELGDGKPSAEYVCRQCRFGCHCILKNWDRRRLYCAAFETRDGDTLKPHKEYLHAEDEIEAKHFFWSSHGAEVTNLVGIAPVIGFFATDKRERKLIV